MKIIINKQCFNINALGVDKKEALKTYELYGKNMDMKEINRRGWQKDLRQYLDKQCDRKVIWVIGKRGNEGKSFFQLLSYNTANFVRWEDTCRKLVEFV